MIAAPLAPPVVVIPQAVDRLVAGPVVVAQEWMEARQDPADGMETTAGVTVSYTHLTLPTTSMV
mgnify:CR=1 FL=1